MYKLIANPYYIKRENIKRENMNIYNIQNDLLFLKLKEKYRDLELNDFMNILNLIDDYFKQKIIKSLIDDIVDGCIFDIQN